MSFTPINPLEEALQKAANDPMYRPMFYEELIQSEIYLIQTGEGTAEDGPMKLEEGDEFQLSTIEMNNKEYIPIFSSLERIGEVMDSGYGYIAMNALDIMEMTIGGEIMLNPNGEMAKEFTKEEIQFILKNAPSWKKKLVPEEAPKGQLIIGEPEVYPDELVEKLSKLFATINEVKRAWVANIMIVGEDEKPHSLVAIEVTDNIEDIVQKSSRISQVLNLPDPPVDYLQITGEGGVEDYFLDESTPFYTK